MKLRVIPSLVMLCITLSLNSTNLFAQGEANIWQFYTKWGLDFNSGTPVPITNSALCRLDAGAREGEGCSSVADASGNLLFYTNGVTVYDRNGNVMTGGNGTLLGDVSSTQSAVIVPANITGKRYYYIFTSPPEELSQDPGGGAANSTVGLCYSIVDMDASGGLGSVINANIRITPAGENASEALTVVPHFVAGRFWVIGHEAASSTVTTTRKFYIYGVTSINTTTGVITFSNNSVTMATSVATTFVPGGPSGNGQSMIKVNSCFNKIAYSPFAKAKLVELYNFNNNTGAFTLANTITNFDAGDASEVYGLEFSPNGTFLYATVLGSRVLYQFNISSGVDATINGAGARTRWTESAGSSLRWGQLQLGPDGKIYMSKHTNWDVIGAGAATATIGVINSPNTAGAGANFDEDQIQLTAPAGIGSKHGLPQIYKGFIAGTVSVTPGPSIAGLDQVCVGEPADFEANYTQNGTNWQWNIDANVGPNTTVEYTTQNIVHTYSSAGTYTIILTLQDATCGYTVTETTQIIVNPIVNSAGTVNCGPPISGTVNSPNGAYDYVWYTDAGATNAIATGTTGVTLPGLGTSGTVYLKAMSSASSSSFPLSNGPLATPNDNPASGSTIDFSVNKSTLTFTSFEWKAGNCTYSATDVFQNATITITNTGTSAVVYSRVQSVKVADISNSAGASYTENVNTVLPPGNYRINITGLSTGIRYRANWNGCGVNMNDAQGALTYNTASNTQCVATNFQYTLNEVNATGLACSKVATIPFNCTLPVTWLSFTGKHTSSGNLLNWATATEENSAYFEIERSLDGVNFEYVGSVNAAGNSSQVKNYSFVDPFESAAVVYYRLKQFDIDGAFNYSNTVAINGVSTGYTLLPNPGNGVVFISGGNDEDAIQVNVLDIHGRAVKGEITTHSGAALDLSDLPKGVYLIQLIDSNSSVILRYVLQ